ncbi:olfactory receptor 2AP1-like [Tiliqua scincoides]|uniref:olfactory receptor 2AP1-like n=1 Tax=Tiliqua scincoides TaxID=71010 RepID=UPI00346248D5
MGKQKAFSTCSSHLLVVIIYYGSLMGVYVLPGSNKVNGLPKVYSIFYTILTPMINPIIYSLRNKEVQLFGNTELKHQTNITEFILLGFGEDQVLQILLFLAFLFICVMTMAGNILIILLVATDHHLQTPMYVFLGNLSCLEICCSSNVLPRILSSFITGRKTLSINACLAQHFFFASFGAVECYLLSVMSYDRYLAICSNKVNGLPKVYSIFYTILTPMINPIIYSLRNKEMQSTAYAQWTNQTVVTFFILLGFGDLSQLQIPLFLVFVVIYIMTMTGNILIVALLLTDLHLQTPMYFFLGNLSFLEICYTSTIIPRMLASFLTGDKVISMSACMAQLYSFGTLAATECYLLAVMSYDRYIAICKPLRYSALMNWRISIQLATCSWVSGFLGSTVVIVLTSSLTFCKSNEIDHFFCDFPPLVKLSCSDTSLAETALLVVCSIISMFPIALTLTSYICIINTILKISTTMGKQKAFSTCSSHLIVVSVFYGSLLAVYLVPSADSSKTLNKIVSLFYTVLTPLFNPLIYTLRNKEVNQALKKCLGKLISSRRL